MTKGLGETTSYLCLFFIFPKLKKVFSRLVIIFCSLNYYREDILRSYLRNIFAHEELAI